MPRALHEVVFVDGVRTPFGKAGDKGMYAQTRADDLVIRCIRELLHRNPNLPKDKVEEVAIAATTQIGDQGLTLGRTAALLSGLPNTTPGYSVDRMCAGAMTAVTNTASSIAFGAYDIAIAGGVEHMGRHPMGEGVDPNPRIVSEKIVDPDALVMGKTAENLHDRFPQLTKQRSDAFAVGSQDKLAAGVCRRQDPARPRHRGHPPRREGLGPGHRRRAAAPRHDRRRPRPAQDPVPRPRQRDRGQRRRSQRRCDRVPPRLRAGRHRPRPAGAHASGVASRSSASSPRSWASARSRPPRRPSPRRA